MKNLLYIFVLLFVVNCSSGGSAASEEGLKNLKAPSTEFSLASPSYKNGGTIPEVYTCEGSHKSPPLKWFNAPKGTKSFALIFKDPDAPSGLWTHWVVYDIPATTTQSIESSSPKGAKIGKNEMKTAEYAAPCPPDGKHRYIFDLYALDVDHIKTDDDSRSGVEKAIKDHILAKTSLEATYSK
jgi:Raf kinase inhibitor-like YbhB/YbcL family protein